MKTIYPIKETSFARGDKRDFFSRTLSPAHLRRSVAAEWDDIKTVQGNLGHATAAFTLDVYGHVSEKMKENSAARMEKYMSSMA